MLSFRLATSIGIINYPINRPTSNTRKCNKPKKSDKTQVHTQNVLAEIINRLNTDMDRGAPMPMDEML